MVFISYDSFIPILSCKPFVISNLVKHIFIDSVGHLFLVANVRTSLLFSDSMHALVNIDFTELLNMLLLVSLQEIYQS